MSFSEAVRMCFRKFADFTGRASRPENWLFGAVLRHRLRRGPDRG